MKKLKGLSLLLFCFVFLLSACGGGNNTSQSQPAPSPESTNTTPQNTAEPEPSEEPPVDLGGRIIKVAAWWDLKPAGATAGDKARLEKIAEVEKNITANLNS